MQKSRVICATDNEFPQELRTVRFNFEPKRCKSVSLSAKRSVSTLVGLARSSNGETAFSVKSEVEGMAGGGSVTSVTLLGLCDAAPQRLLPRDPCR